MLCSLPLCAAVCPCTLLLATLVIIIAASKISIVYSESGVFIIAIIDKMSWVGSA